ncbi:OprD family outer membrane porin [Pseudomonas sp. F1_0610]|uniref:OprD family outer membrane porin n=1 Tax=Pseudomonas sp. F1_0610 TaxID=3114284 RepID=UPI0039C08856
MKMMKWSVLAVAVAAASTQAVASQQDEATGFIEGSKLDLNTRLFYFGDEFTNKKQRKAQGVENKYADELGLGFRAEYKSGFTQGTVGFGIDAWGLSAVRLDSGRGRHEDLSDRTAFFQERGNGKVRNTYGQAGGAVKARISNTTAKYGSFVDIDTPVFSMDDSRLLPESATGFFVTSEEIENLTLNLGHFTALSEFTETDRDSFGLDKLDMLGGTYNVLENLDVSYYYSRAKFNQAVLDNAKKHYLGANYGLDLGNDQALDFGLNYYRTKLNGKSGQGHAKNNAWSLQGAYSIDAHKFTLAYQRMGGDTGYIYGYDGGGSIYLANDIQINSFIQNKERSWKARYDLDMGKLAGINGLSFAAMYVRGSNIHNAHTSNGKNWERDLEVAYTFQEGPAKDLNIRLRQASYRASNGAAASTGLKDMNEVRLIVNYPLSIL